ncbi:Asp-tRNA(Asn)/Glu-tRNA(Gln) amidotransferase subunit GatC [Candidatus Roizmanbacteria bacterium]|nr:Asp-tRNA(Asn)/Glu-tRNA(Gln) amidotransferase subunit GatC [Candidatus Roizmanbacteria bacterium]
MKKNTLTKKDILHLAKLSRLQLNDKEIEKYLSQLEETVKYVNNLKELNTEKVTPTSQTTNLSNVGFVDGKKNTRNFTQENATLNSKNKNTGNFVVKRIM